ncbi:MAG: hypothetical protein ABIH18_03030 [Candidatus Omnitrophota bacterium]
MKEIKIPKYFSHNTIDEVLKQREVLLLTEKCQPSEDVIFDLRDNVFVSILGILLIAELSDFLQEDKKCKCFVKTKKGSLQLLLPTIMGLVKRDNPNQEVENYLNQIRVPIQRCHNDKESLGAVNRLMPIIRQELNLPEPLLKALNWALWELVGNAGLHGYRMYAKKDCEYSKPVYFCAFDYKDFIDIAILDVGCGIYNSFLKSGRDKYKNITNAEALSLSIKKSETGDPGGSTGFGLFGCAEIARKAKGKLVIISGVNKLIVSAQGEEVLSSGKFDGTMVLLSIPQKSAIDLADILGKRNISVVLSLDDLIGGIDVGS